MFSVNSRDRTRFTGTEERWTSCQLDRFNDILSSNGSSFSVKKTMISLDVTEKTDHALSEENFHPLTIHQPSPQLVRDTERWIRGWQPSQLGCHAYELDIVQRVRLRFADAYVEQLGILGDLRHGMSG